MHLLHTRHVHGKVNEVMHVEMKDLFLKWEAKNQLELKKVIALIGQIKEIAGKRTKDGKCVLVCEKTRPLTIKVYEDQGRDFVVSKEMKSLFWDNNNKDNGGKA
jgi:CTP-dependent riboflavin kinase